MNPNEQEIERLLRSAPKPSPPPDLKQQLSAQIRLPVPSTPSQASLKLPLSSGWLRRWWPVLAPATVSLICAVVLAAQQLEIRNLRDSVNTRSKSVPAIETATPAPTTEAQLPTIEPTDPARAEQEEIARLQQRVKQLTAEIEQLEQTQKENEALRRQIAAPPALTPEELDAQAKAKEKALSIACMNNLKQFGLAVRVWALDNHEVFPPDPLSMSNELSTPKILVCPAETNRPVARNWETFTSANLSYEYLTSSATNADLEPQRVLSRCPFHGHIGLCDGSVHGSVAKNRPDWLVERDGKLYMESSPQSGQRNPNR